MKEAFRYFFSPEEALPRNEICLLVDGKEAFPAILRAIDSAVKKIGFEIYMFSADEIGSRVRAAFERALDRGCEVRIVYDSLGSYPNTFKFFEPIVKRGGRVIEYHPIRQWRYRMNVDHLSRRNHRKLLIVDDSTVVLGGLNVNEEYARPVEAGGVHDLGVEIRGPIVSQAWRTFERTWKDKTSQAVPTAELLSSKTDAPSKAQLIGSDNYLNRWRLRRTLLYAISQASHSVDLVNPYFLPAPDMISYLKKAVRRGVKVRLLVPKSSDVKVVDLASLVVQRRLTKYGIEVYRWPGQVHGKAILVDGVWYSIGSYNFDYQSLFRNLEVIVNVADSDSSRRLRDVIEGDIRQSSLWQDGSWRAMPWYVRLLALLLYRLRRFL